MLIEGKAVDVLQEHPDPCNETKFGVAQKVHANLCNFCEGGAMTHVSMAVLESHLTCVHLDKTWTKTVTAFVTVALHLIWDHK